MRAYSQDLRECVLRAVDQGHPRAEIVQIFGVSLATIKRYLKQQREHEQNALIQHADEKRLWLILKRTKQSILVKQPI